MSDRSSQVDQLLASTRNNRAQSKGMRERLAELFKGTEYVTIKNSLDVEFAYVYTDPSKENVESPDKTTRRVYFADPEARILQPGEEKVILGWEAYLALNHMFKQYAQSHKEKTGIVLGSSGEIDGFLQRSYLGKFDPNTVLPGNTNNLGFDRAEQGADRSVEVVHDASEQDLLDRGVSQEQIDQQIADNGTEDAAAVDLGFSNEAPQTEQAPVIDPLHDQEQRQAPAVQ